MKNVRILIIAAVLLIEQSVAGVSGDSTGWLHISFNASLILNRASLFTKEQNDNGHLDQSSILPLGNKNNIMPGYMLGVSGLIGKRANKLIFGLAFSCNRAQYKIAKSQVTFDNIPAPYQSSLIKKNYDCYDTYYLINYELGLESALLSPNIFMQNVLVVNSNWRTISDQRGYETTSYYTNYLPGPGAPQNISESRTDGINKTETISDHRKNQGVSYRIAFGIKQRLWNREYKFAFYRNFSLLRNIPRPWWGISISLVI